MIIKDDILDKKVKKMFSDTKLTKDNFSGSKILKKENIIANLHNKIFIYDYLKKLVVNTYVNDNLIRAYIASDNFNNMINIYEENIIRTQINNMLKNKAYYITKQKYHGNINCYDDYDIIFRDTVSYTLNKINIDNNLIEKVLEEEYENWSKPTMNLALINTYNYLSGSLYAHLNMSDAYKRLWIKNREFEYFIRNKDSILKYSKPNSNQRSSLSDISVVRYKLSVMNNNLTDYDYIDNDNDCKIIKIRQV